MSRELLIRWGDDGGTRASVYRVGNIFCLEVPPLEKEITKQEAYNHLHKSSLQGLLKEMEVQ